MWSLDLFLLRSWHVLPCPSAGYVVESRWQHAVSHWLTVRRFSCRPSNCTTGHCPYPNETMPRPAVHLIRKKKVATCPG